MKTNPKVQEDSKPKVPGYIVTYSDMVTLLLTFFVMLLSLAEVQDPELFNKGRDSFWDSLRFCGLGTLFGKRMSVNLGDMKLKFKTIEPNKTEEGRTIDEQRERLRRTFERIAKSLTTMQSQIVSNSTSFTVTNIRFDPDSSLLKEAAKKYLSGFCQDVQQRPPSDRTLYAVGLTDKFSDREQWLLSAKRAQAVGDYLTEVLSPTSAQLDTAIRQDSKWSVFSWAAAPGGNWAGQDETADGQSKILIAILSDSK